MPVPEIIRYLESKLAAVRPPGEEELAAGSSVAISRYVEGLTADTEFQGELEALGYSGARLNNLLLQGVLRRQLELYRDRLALWRQQVKDNVLAPSELLTLMEREGVGGDVVEMERQRMEAQTPTQPILSTEVTLSVLEIEEIAARPVAVATEVTLAVLGAETVEEAAVEILPSDVSLVILGVEEIPPPAPEVGVEITLAILESEEV